MPESPLLSSFRNKDAMAEKLYPDIFTMPNQVPTDDAYRHVLTDDLPAVRTDNLMVREEQAYTDTEQLLAKSGPLADAATTQSLISALQGTVTGPSRPVMVIPGKKRAARVRDAARPQKRLPYWWRWGLTAGILAFFLAFFSLSLTPLGAADDQIPIIGGLVRFVHTEAQNLGFNAHQLPPTKAPNPPPMMLPKSQYVAIARQDAIDAGIPPDYFERQINAESSFNPNAISPAGAIGIAQFLPSTAAGLGFDPHDPIASLKGAAKYMATYYNKYGQNYAKALTAYNAGSGTVDRAVSQGGANWMNYIPAETRHYIYVIMGI